jgi:hypothetical protein
MIFWIDSVTRNGFDNSLCAVSRFLREHRADAVEMVINATVWRGPKRLEVCNRDGIITTVRVFPDVFGAWEAHPGGEVAAFPNSMPKGSCSWLQDLR